MTWRHANAALGAAAAAFGLWLVWPRTELAATVGVGLAALYVWRQDSIGMIWVWSTALIGLESLAWPLITMVQARSLGPEPTPEQMGVILTAVVGGLLASIFWLTFAYGLYRRVASTATAAAGDKRA